MYFVMRTLNLKPENYIIWLFESSFLVPTRPGLKQLSFLTNTNHKGAPFGEVFFFIFQCVTEFKQLISINKVNGVYQVC